MMDTFQSFKALCIKRGHSLFVGGMVMEARVKVRVDMVAFTRHRMAEWAIVVCH
jgi:hypothetical protein